MKIGYNQSGSSDAILMLTNAGASVAATDRDGLTGNTHLFFRFFFAVHHHAFQKLKKKR